MWERCDEARPPAGRDPDVVGLGTLIACGGSACIAVICLVIQYLFFYLPQGEDEQQQSHVANPIDVLLVSGLRKPLKYLGIKSSRSTASQNEGGRWPAAFDQYVKTLGDVQLAVGIAMLIYGYVSLTEQGLSMYHWWLIVGLVWFTVITNLATNSYLRTYFIKRDPGERWWRIILLICLVITLSFSMIPIYQIREKLANEHDEDMQRRILKTANVLCYLPGHDSKIDTPQFRSTVALIGIAVIVGLVIIGLLRLYERPSSIIFKWRDQFRGELQQSFFGDGDNIITCIRCEQRHLLLVVRPVLAFWLVLRVYADLLNSVLTEIVCAAATFAWVTIRFIDILRLGGGFEFDGRHWNFGQVLALVFFAAPLGSLAGCLLSTLGRLGSNGSRIFKRPEAPKFTWVRSILEKARPRHLPKTDVEDPSTQPLLTPTEGDTGPIVDVSSGAVETNQEVHVERNSLENESDQTTKTDNVNTYRILLSPRFVIALPLAGFSNLLHLVLLLVLPKVPGYPSTPDVLWRTIFWYVVYQPLLLFAFFLAGMIVEERVTREGRMLFAYRVIATIIGLLSTAAIFDTLYGIGGIPMSYIGMGTLGLILLVYLLYGCVARPGPLAKGKSRSKYTRGGDVEEGQPLLQESRRRILPEVRAFPVRKQKRWHGPSRRPQVTRGRRSYGTID
ncbi:uncharacterized protein F4822DRAFT_54548 [Hypoxylon trugodes]|uniref:uncharacterized protein n=1 Tax=Hypoxylon trugodes TaxID=326681 RepID=UPI00219CF813|nr:uncharacterized protein F4822DRAFT_54548 [Hypoxylon trugodes]KAI1383893.1 hypothetical protein F4822DRAFT_54548 [Hypoxylon trugodes]